MRLQGSTSISSTTSSAIRSAQTYNLIIELLLVEGNALSPNLTFE